MPALRDVAIVSYCRTGIAKAQRGALNQTHGIPLLSHVLKGSVARANIEGGEVEDVVVGCRLPEGATGHNVGRNQMQLETPWETTNVNGGAIALGHPYGIRYAGSVLMELGRRNKKRAIIGVCTAGGMATAALVERP